MHAPPPWSAMVLWQLGHFFAALGLTVSTLSKPRTLY